MFVACHEDGVEGKEGVVEPTSKAVTKLMSFLTCPQKEFSLVLAVMLICGAVAGSMIFGAAVGLTHPTLSPMTGGLALTLGAGSGWLLSLVVFFVVLRERFSVFLVQCLVVMNIGVGFLLLPSLALVGAWFFQLDGPIPLIITITGVALDASLMWVCFRARARALGLPRQVPALWFFLLQAGGLPLLIKFKLFFY